MGDPDFIKTFRDGERPGLYCRVLQEGEIRQGESVRIESYEEPMITLIEMFREFYDPTYDEAEIRRLLAAPIAIRDRMDKEKRLDRILKK